MKMGSVNMAVAVAMALMIGSLLHKTEAQETQYLTNGADAPFNDATTLVNQLIKTPGQCCQTNSGFCTVSYLSPGPTGWCPDCTDLGNGLNKVLAQCNEGGEVEGVYSPDGTAVQVSYITSAFNHPYRKQGPHMCFSVVAHLIV